MLNTKLLPCPFCGQIPELPAGIGTQYEVWCECGHACSTIQISDLMTIKERRADAFGPPNFQHGQEYVDRAAEEVIRAWNTRHCEQKENQ